MKQCCILARMPPFGSVFVAVWSIAEAQRVYHLQASVHWMPFWKHSQYFFKQRDLRQLHPLLCCCDEVTTCTPMQHPVTCMSVN